MNTIKFDLQKYRSSIIKVIGVGGGGSNAVNHMYKQGIVGVDFAICNTDNQAMDLSPVPSKIQLGPNLTEGMGAGSRPEVGKKACLESIEDIKSYLGNGCKMLFVTAGMGGGTGTGAAPIIAKAAKEMDILTVGIVTLPFSFEGKKRTTQGFEGLQELRQNVDTIIVISNDKLREIYGNMSFSNAFSQADNILSTAAKSIAEIITKAGLVNVDFEDVNTVMRDSGVAIMGIATADGENRARIAVDAALTSPLLEDNNISGAKQILVNITYGSKEVTMDEITEITTFVQEEAGNGSNLIWGANFDDSLGEKLSVTVIATGFEHGNIDPLQFNQPSQNKDRIIKVNLDDDFSGKKLGTVYDVAYNEGDSANTIEFDTNPNSKPYTVQSPSKPSFNPPPTPTPSKAESDEMERRRLLAIRDNYKKEKLKPNNLIKLTNPNIVNELENEPAYLRRGVILENNFSANHEPSDSTIIFNEDNELVTQNKYLYKKLD